MAQQVYTIDTAKIWDDKIRNFVTVPQMATKLKAEAEAQMSELFYNADKGITEPRPEFVEKYEKARDDIILFLEEQMAATMSTALLQEVAENMWAEFSSDQVDVDDVGAFGTWMGGFIEENWFGLNPKGNSPFPDLKMIELKAHTSMLNIRQIAGITLENVPQADEEQKRAANVAAAYRMFLKMQNFLIVRMGRSDEVQSRGGKHYRKVHYDYIFLHMTLILKDVWNIIFDKTIETIHKPMTKPGQDVPNKAIIAVVKTPWKNGKVAWDIKMDLNKIDGVYNFVKLYLYHLNLLSEMKLNNGMRISFFTGIRDLKESWKLKDLGASPNFNIQIRP